MTGQPCSVNRIQWKGLRSAGFGTFYSCTKEREQGPSGVHVNTRPRALSVTLAKALDLHVGKWEFEPPYPCSRRLGDPSVHLSYWRGLQGHEEAGGEKADRDARSKEPPLHSERMEFKVGEGFSCRVEFKYGSPRERRNCRGWEKTEIRH